MKAHPALYLLSPKGEPLARAGTLDNVTHIDMMEQALSYGWLVNGAEKPRSASTSPYSMASAKSYSTLSSVEMIRMTSRASQSSFTTAATSVASSQGSVLERKRPISQRESAYFAGARATPIRRVESKPILRNARSCSLLAVVAQPTSVPMERSIRPAASMFDISQTAKLQRPAPSYRRSSMRLASLQEPRADLLQLWEEVELQQKVKPSPPKKVLSWFGKLRKGQAKSMANLNGKRVVKEPQVKRTRSIEQLLMGAN